MHKGGSPVAPYSSTDGADLISAAGKLFVQNGAPFYFRGVTYGTFAPDENGFQFPDRQRVREDFSAIATNGFNTVRLYTAPPTWLLDLAGELKLKLLVGLAWEQHVAFLDDRTRTREICKSVADQVESCARHPTIAGFTIGNEIPSSIVRWHGRNKIERFLHTLFEISKAGHPDALATYVNYPTTEYLELPFLDFLAANVYLEDEDKLRSYLRRLQNIAADRPLVLAEIGLDSRRHGEDDQAQSLDWQLRAAFSEGCAGVFTYAWTDEWFRGGHDIEDWDFGLTTRARTPKAALRAARAVMAQAPFPETTDWPKISVVVCSYNGSKTIRDTLEALKRVDYPDFEVIVVNDGSTDETPEIAKAYDVRLITTKNQGLGQARNVGLEAARGELIVYTDDDAYPPPPWLKYLALSFMRSEHACIGGPNLVPPEDGIIGQCVADSPGGPLHVLLTDDLAEHVPGCNMAFRRKKLAAIGGFDPLYRAAGDDVDVCWRLQERGWTVGFSPAAMVWHHRRATMKRYWRQQVGYGKAEALLEQKWPERFSALGHMSWAGHIYGRGLALPFIAPRPRVYQGTWGLALFQGLYQSSPSRFASLALTPEWLLLAGIFLMIGAGGFFFPLAALGLVPAFGMILASVAQACRGVSRSRYLIRARGLPVLQRGRSAGIIFLFHLIQPMARLWGRLKHGLTPWRRRGGLPVSTTQPISVIWSEHWRAPEDWLAQLSKALRGEGAVTRNGGDYDSWDLEIRGGIFARLRLTMAIEEHGAGRQYLRFRRSIFLTGLSRAGLAIASIFCLLALISGSISGIALSSFFAAGLILQIILDERSARRHIDAALVQLKRTAVPDQDQRKRAASFTNPEELLRVVG